MGISTMARVGVLRVYAWRIGSGLRGGGICFQAVSGGMVVILMWDS